MLCLVMAVFVLTSGVFHFFDLAADPPRGLSWSAGAYFDGLSNSHTARSYVLFGRFRPDEWDPYLYSPTHVLLQIGWFRLFAPGVRSTNGFGALLSFAAVLAGISLFRHARVSTLLLAALFFSLSCDLVQFGRLGLFENLMILLMFASLTCLAGGAPGRLRSAGAGAFCMLAYATKAISVYFLPAVAAAALVCAYGVYARSGRVKAALGILLWVGLGWLVVFVPWLFLFKLPNAAAITKIGLLWKATAWPDSFGVALRRAATTPVFFFLGRHDLLWLFVPVISAVVFYGIVTRPASMDPVAVGLAVWFWCGLGLTSVLKHNPPRYFFPLLPAALGLSAYGLGQVVRTESIGWRARRAWLADLLGIVALTIFLRFYFVYHVTVDPLLPPSLPRVWSKLLVCFVLACVLWVAGRIGLRLWGRRIRLPRQLRLGAVCMLCVHFAWGNVRPLLHSLRHPHYTIVEFSRTLRDYPAMVIGGTSALAAVAETEHVAVRMGQRWYNDKDPFERFGLTHLFLTDYAGELAHFFDAYPAQMRCAEELQKVRVCGYPFHLYALPGAKPAQGLSQSRP